MPGRDGDGCAGHRSHHRDTPNVNARYFTGLIVWEPGELDEKFAPEHGT